MNKIKFVKLKFFFAIITFFFIIVSCSMVDKLKEKIGSKDSDSKENKKEDTKEVTSTADLEFYNEYIGVSNKIQESGEKVYKDYVANIPEPKDLPKASYVIAVAFSLSVDNLDRVYKEYSRSFNDGGKLSKLNASDEMKTEIEGNLKSLLKAMEEYYNTSRKVADYYTKDEYKSDMSKAQGYDDDMKRVYDAYKSAFDKFAGSLKKYKPKREVRDPESISNPDERSVAVLMNSYESTLDAAEEFYGEFNGLEYKGDFTKSKTELREFEEIYGKDKSSVMNAEFSEKTKYMKYSYEDYFSKMTKMFTDAANKFFDKAPDAKDIQEFNRLYDDVINNYNYMITAYNSNINIVNSFRVY